MAILLGGVHCESKFEVSRKAVGGDMADEEKSSTTHQPRELETTTSGSDGLATTLEVDTMALELHTSADGYVIVPLGPLKQARRKGTK